MNMSYLNSRFLGNQNKKWKKITKAEHIRKHTRKENTHDFDCPYCQRVKF